MHPLDGSRSKTERAKKHVQDLKLALEAFKASDPYGISIKHNPQTGQLIYYASKITDVPSDIPAIAGDAIHNLRSALDYLVYRLVGIGIGGEPKSKRIEFPIFESAKENSSGKNRKIQGMRPDAEKVIDSIKPYKGGNDQLWRIHKLDIIDKHRLLISFGSKLRSVDLGTTMTKQMREQFSELDIPILSAFFKVKREVRPLEAGDELLIVNDRDAKADKDMKFLFEVALFEPQVIEGEPIIIMLQQFIDIVEDIIKIFGEDRFWH